MLNNYPLTLIIISLAVLSCSSQQLQAMECIMPLERIASPSARKQYAQLTKEKALLLKMIAIKLSVSSILTPITALCLRHFYSCYTHALGKIDRSLARVEIDPSEVIVCLFGVGICLASLGLLNSFGLFLESIMNATQYYTLKKELDCLRGDNPELSSALLPA